MTSLDVDNQTFRELLRKVALDGLPRDARPRTVKKLADLCEVSRTYFYHAIAGSYVVSEETTGKIARGLKKVSRWITPEMVAAALRRSRTMHEMKLD